MTRRMCSNRTILLGMIGSGSSADSPGPLAPPPTVADPKWVVPHCGYRMPEVSATCRGPDGEEAVVSLLAIRDNPPGWVRMAHRFGRRSAVPKVSRRSGRSQERSFQTSGR